MMPMLPTIGVFAASAIRLLQSVNRISTHLSSIAYYETSLNFVCDNIDVTGLKGIDRNESRSKERISIKKGVEVKDITYRYPGTEKKIFDHASMSIPVGKSIGVVGVSGAGKTTVIDILLGLLKPEEGSVYADGRDIHDDLPAYLHDTGYIAQNIYMLDATIRENVAFGEKREDISDERVWEALREAQLEDFVKSLPDGLDTQTGDRGVRISGGQRQRIGSARALYNDPELLIFDEATSALDNDTEAAIMEAINALKGRKTMVIIAHRLGTIENCDIIYRVENGKIETTKI
jgi:ABC-type multidrug transport system fused ATPase/permease subunit